MTDHGRLVFIDLDLAGSAPTRFAVVTPSLRTTRRLLATLRGVRDSSGDMFGELLAVVAPLLRSWKNATDVETGEPVEFDPAALDRILEAKDLVRLAGSIISGGRLTEADAKN